jgi:hypothetical protein
MVSAGETTLPRGLVQREVIPFPARVIFGSEELASTLASEPGVEPLTANGCLVVPLVRPGVLDVVTSGDSRAQRIVTCLERLQTPSSLPATIGSIYPVVPTERTLPNKQFRFNVHIVPTHREAARQDIDKLNRLLRLWGIMHRGTEYYGIASLVHTPESVSPQRLYEIVEGYVHKDAVLGPPIVVEPASYTG